MPALACQFRIDPFQYTAARFTTDPLLLMQLEYTTLKAKQEIGFNFVIQLHVGAGSLKQRHTARRSGEIVVGVVMGNSCLSEVAKTSILKTELPAPITLSSQLVTAPPDRALSR